MYRDMPPPSPLIYAGVQSSLFAYDRTAGARVWEAQFSGYGSVHRLAFVDGHVVAVLSRAVGLVVAASGEIVWTVETPFDVATLLVDGDRIVIAGQGRLACYDLRGALLWWDDLKGYGIGPLALGVPGNVANVDHG